MSNGPFDFNYITCKEAAEKGLCGDIHDIKHYQKLARASGECEVCGQPVWRFGGCGMCFPCTTGESDASNDYELIPE